MFKDMAIALACFIGLVVVVYLFTPQSSISHTPAVVVDHSQDETRTQIMSMAVVRGNISMVAGVRANGNSVVIQVNNEYHGLSKSERTEAVAVLKKLWLAVLKPQDVRTAKVVVCDSGKNILPETYADY